MKRFIHNFVLLTIVSTAVVLPHAVFGATDSGFVLLTGNDGPLARGTEATSLPGFLNNVYTIMIGAAVVLAILQIIRGGITWMLTDSVYEKGQARHLITIAIMGLVLILSPVIVFNVINPKILNLDITDGLSALSNGLVKQTAPGGEEEGAVPEEGQSVVDGEFVKAKLFRDDLMLSSNIANFVGQECSGYTPRNPVDRMGENVLVVCRKSIGFGLYMDFDGDFYNDPQPAVKISNYSDRQKKQKLDTECSALTQYGYRVFGLNSANKADFCGFLRICPSSLFSYGIDDSCQGGEHDLALSDPLAPDRTRICNYFESENWCSK